MSNYNANDICSYLDDWVCLMCIRDSSILHKPFTLDHVCYPHEMVNANRLSAIKSQPYAFFKGVWGDPGALADLHVVFVRKDPDDRFFAKLPTPRYIT